MTTTPRLVTAQAALDAALAEGVIDLIVEAPNGAYLDIRHGFVRLWGSSSAVLWGSSRAELWGSSSAVLCESSSAELWGSSSAELRGSSRAELRESSTAETGRWTVVHVWSQRVTLTGEGHIIDMTKVDLTDVETWRAYVGADTLVRPDRDRLIVGHVSSQDHEGRLDRDGTITIGCFAGDVAKLRNLAASSRWPSHADAEKRDKYRPRLLAFADLCEQQIEAWAEVKP